MIPTTRKRRTTPCRRQPFHPTDRGADAHFECPSGTSTRGAFLNGIDHALTQVQRIAGWHGLFPNLSPGRLASRADSRKVRDARRVERIGKCSRSKIAPCCKLAALIWRTGRFGGRYSLKLAPRLDVGLLQSRSLLESVAVYSPPTIQITEPTRPAQHAAANASSPINRRAYFLSTSRCSVIN